MQEHLFYVDLQRGISVSYRQLIEELKSITHYTPYCKSADYYEVFKNLLCSILCGQDIVLLDADFTDAEITKLLGADTNINKTDPVIIPQHLTSENLLPIIRNCSQTWHATLFSSGTTSLPKGVKHSFETLTRQVRCNEHHSNDVWGFAYNATHMAGLQVFFQAVMNGNTIVRLFGLNSPQIIKAVNQYLITHISATPTFYRLLLPPADSCPSVVRLTSGGEQFDAHTLSELSTLFPYAKIANIYASTEAGSLFASRGNDFVIQDSLQNKVCILGGELLIHKSLLGEFQSEILEGEWYHTGDVVEVVNHAPLTIHFVSRKNEMINVGGYKVNPHEVEEVIRSCYGVADALVYAKRNRLLGNVILCDVVRSDLSISEKQIREVLQGQLQEFKIPRMIRFVEYIQTTRTGKISRKQ